MVNGHVYIAMTLDGFIARPDHRLDWLTKQATDGEEHGYDDFIEGVDAIIMGRGTYETVRGFGDWPYEKHVIVMSKRLTKGDVPIEIADKASITALEPMELMRSLRRQGMRRVYVDGGRVIQSFIRAGLIEDIVVTIVPILIGEGRRLFGEIDGDVDLELIEVKSFDSGLVQAKYRVLGSADPKQGD